MVKRKEKYFRLFSGWNLESHFCGKTHHGLDEIPFSLLKRLYWHLKSPEPHEVVRELSKVQKLSREKIRDIVDKDITDIFENSIGRKFSAILESFRYLFFEITHRKGYCFYDQSKNEYDFMLKEYKIFENFLVFCYEILDLFEDENDIIIIEEDVVSEDENYFLKKIFLSIIG